MTPPEQPARLRDGVHYIPTAFETRLRQWSRWKPHSKPGKRSFVV
jgi:hypothetical protein